MASAFSEAVNESWESIHDFVVKQGNGVKGLSDMGLKSLPNRFVQPLNERIVPTSVSAVHDHETIPIIDMSSWDTDPKVADSVCDAAETWGFFHIVNHGVPLHVLQNIKDATHRFFELPAEKKRMYMKEHSGTNNVWFGTSFSPDAEKALEWKDYLSLFYVSEAEVSSLWPPECREQVIEYMKSSESVIKNILEALMKRLNVDEIDESTRSILMGSKRINLNYYPICPNPELTVGVGRHSDVSTLTFLLQDDIGGLYVRGPEGHSWIHVSPVIDSIVINVGDALQITSNGRYKSIEHRVAANGTRNRISVPIFVNPKPSDIIGPMPQVTSYRGKEPIYRQVRYSDYVKHFFKKAHDGKNTIDYVKI